MERNEYLVPRESPTLVSVVVPLYNEGEVVPFLRERLEELAANSDHAFEWILVDDGSRDATLRLLKDWADDSPRAVVVGLSRNFGHQIALTAGLHFAQGDAIAVIDADLQDPPELIPEMVEGYCEGYEVIYGQRRNREGESWFRTLTAEMFYRLMRVFVVKDLPHNTGDFRLMSRKVVDDLVRLNERDRFLRGLVTWVGYKQKALHYDRPPRIAGKTKYPFLRMFRFAVNAIISFSDLPLRIIMWLGLSVVVISMFMVLRILYIYYFTDSNLVPGWASIIVSLYFLAGVLLFSLGTLGLYVGRIYTEVLNRPLYFVAHTFGRDRNK